LISLVLYGRNDSHGYNLHRRAALSLNCLAEVLTDDGDEIVFVDYNTPDELPTFVEALADTLTDRCLDLLRVFRVPAALHRERFSALTHLPVPEPVCRNAAARRASPANRWLLSTNTDMILVPSGDVGLSGVCRELPDGFYGLPRFELPEWLWERLPRTDPGKVLHELSSLGPRLRLDETTLNDEWVRYDAPGDFQLCLREDFVAIDGFDEEMIHGWHVDSNFGRRMVIHRGVEDSLDDRVAGYHCNHSRTPTVYGSAAVGNDLTRFYTSVERAGLPAQRETWGLPDVELEQVQLRPRTGSRFTEVVASVIPDATAARAPSELRRGWLTLTYDSSHVLPFVADSIAVSPRGTRIGYLGANPALEGMLARLVDRLSDDDGFALVTACDASGLDRVDEADVLVVDLGLDSSLTPGPEPQHEERDGFPPVPSALRAVVLAFERLVQQERARLERGAHSRRFVLVNSTTAYADAFVVSNLDCSHTSMHSRVRRANVKLVPTSGVRALRDIGWSDRLERPRVPLQLHVGDTAELGELEHLDSFGPGWWFPDPNAVWTRGPRAVITVACRDLVSRPAVLELSFDRVGVRRGDSLDVSIAIADTRVGRRLLPGGSGFVTWRARIPTRVVAHRSFDIVFELDSHDTWTDERQLGLHLRSVALKSGAIPIPVLDSVDKAKRLVARSRRIRRPWLGAGYVIRSCRAPSARRAR
jgi:hypothetical protein